MGIGWVVVLQVILASSTFAADFSGPVTHVLAEDPTYTQRDLVSCGMLLMER